MSGFGVLALLREAPTMTQVPVVAVTANAMVGDRDQALAIGFDGYLPKPIEPSSFAHTLDTYLPSQLRGHEPRSRWIDDG
jgi:two-component system cell cycle response regulator DivK